MSATKAAQIDDEADRIMESESDLEAAITRLYDPGEIAGTIAYAAQLVRADDVKSMVNNFARRAAQYLAEVRYDAALEAATDPGPRDEPLALGEGHYRNVGVYR